VIAVALALCGALLYGIADFGGGLATKRAAVLVVVPASQFSGLVVLTPFLLLGPGQADATSIAWGAAAGVAGGLGLMLFYRSLANGTMSVVAPLTAVTAAAVPVLAGIALGERPAALVAVGVVVALVAVVLVSAEGGRLPRPRQLLTDPATGGALTAGAAFGLFFVLISRSSPDSGLWPLLGARTASVVLLVGLALAVRPRLPHRSGWPLILALGVADTAANALFLLASRYGLLTITGVLIALYPVSTVLLAQTVLRERISHLQLGGLAAAVAAVALIAAG
jgi:drug/metabolite transporter (DMT)-like permease